MEVIEKPFPSRHNSTTHFDILRQQPIGFKQQFLILVQQGEKRIPGMSGFQAMPARKDFPMPLHLIGAEQLRYGGRLQNLSGKLRPPAIMRRRTFFCATHQRGAPGSNTHEGRNSFVKRFYIHFLRLLLLSNVRKESCSEYVINI